MKRYASTKCQYNRNYATYSEQIGAAGPNLRKLLDMIIKSTSWALEFVPNNATDNYNIQYDSLLPPNTPENTVLPRGGKVSLSCELLKAFTPVSHYTKTYTRTDSLTVRTVQNHQAAVVNRRIHLLRSYGTSCFSTCLQENFLKGAC